MNSPKQVLFQPVDIDDADFAEYVDPKMEAENAEFETFKSEMHDAQFDAKITVGKKLTDSGGRPLGRQVFECFECGIDDYTFSQLCTRIREDFGTGLYKIQGRDSNGKYKFDKTVGILAPGTPDNAPANDVGVLIDKFSDALQRQHMQTEAMFSKLAGPQTGGDAIDQITKLASAVGPFLTAMGIGNREAPKTLLEQLTEYKMMQELFTEGGGGGAGGEANLYSLLGETMKAFGGPIAAAIAAGQATGQVNPQGLLENPKAAPADVDKILETQKQEQETEALKGQIKILVANAEAKTDAVQMAKLIVEKTPEENLDSLFEFLSGDNYLTQMIFLVPEVEAHKNWFTKLRDTVLELLTGEDDPPIVPDESDAGADAETVAGNDKPTDSDISDETNGDAATDT
jgi:hypothetical protein